MYLLKHLIPVFRKAFLAVLLLSVAAGPVCAKAEAEEPVTLTVFDCSQGTPPAEDNRIYRKIRDDFGISFEFDYAGEGEDMQARVLSLLSKDTYPDLIYAGYESSTLIDAGVLVNLLNYISSEKTPRLWKHIEPYRNQLFTYDSEGREALYAVPGSNIYDEEQIITRPTGHAFFLQKQVLESAGYPDVSDITIDQYFDLIDRFLETHTAEDPEHPYIGFAVVNDGWRNYSLTNPVTLLMGYPFDGIITVDRENDYHVETYINKPYAKPYYQRLNEEYLKGALVCFDSFSDYEDAVSEGRVLGAYDQSWGIDNAAKKLEEGGRDKNTYVALGPVYGQGTEGVPEGKTIRQHYSYSGVPNANGFSISVSCRDPERVVGMWEEMMSDEWQLIFYWGIEGEDYEVSDGRLLMSREQYLRTQDPEWQLANRADGLFAWSAKKQGRIADGALAGNAWDPSQQDEVVYGSLPEYDRDFLDHYGYKTYGEFMSGPVPLAPYGEAWSLDFSPVAEAYSQFAMIAGEDIPKIILCGEGQFESLWNDFVGEITPFAEVYEEYMQKTIRNLMGM